jgi:mannose-1-phosphate guanylyltransferase
MDLTPIVLAAGDGTRLACVTRRLHDDGRPKQLALLAGERSPLQQTLDRLTPVAPPARTMVVVGSAHLPLAREQLRRFSGVELVGQPRNLGTGPGLLLALSRVLARTPDAPVVVTPADHLFTRPGRFVGKLPYAASAARAAPSGVCVLAAEADRPATDACWIVPGAPLAERPGASLVEAFVEADEEAALDARAARALFDRGALWNTHVLVGEARRLWALVAAQLPEQARLFERYREALGTPAEALVLARTYAALSPADLARDALARGAGVAVAAVGGSGWSDLRTPERLFASLEGTPALRDLRRRLDGPARLAAARTAA